MNNLSCPLVEVKFAGAESDMSFSGYGAVFGNVDAYGDVIAPGAFADTLSRMKSSQDWPAMLSQHGGLFSTDMTPIGLWTGMEEDSKGLKVEGKLAPTPRGQELYALMKMQPRPAISGLSIGYVAKEWSARSRPEDPRRTLKKVDLMEVSIVTMPANPKARISQVKGLAQMTIRELEKGLTSGTLPTLSVQEAKALLADGFKGLSAMRDAGDEAGLGESLTRLLATLNK